MLCEKNTELRSFILPCIGEYISINTLLSKNQRKLILTLSTQVINPIRHFEKVV